MCIGTGGASLESFSGNLVIRQLKNHGYSIRDLP